VLAGTTIVQKYGGTSVSSVSRIRRVSRRVADTIAGGRRVVVVVSAMGHTTDHLVSLGQRVAPELPVRELDMLLANGETIAAPLLAMCLQGLGVPAISLTGGQAGLVTSGEHSRARIVDLQPARVLRALEEGVTPVVAGYGEMLELASHHGVPIHVRSSFHPRPGTVVAGTAESDGHAIRGIAYEPEVGTLGLYGLPDRPDVEDAILEALAAADIAADVVATGMSEGRVDLVVATGANDVRAPLALVRLAAPGTRAEVIAEFGGLARASIVGRDLLATGGAAEQLSLTLSAARVEFRMTSHTESRITCLVPRPDASRTVQALHAAFRLRQPATRPLVTAG
jgi:aspartokinase